MIDISNLSPSDIARYACSMDESGKYVLSEEERIKIIENMNAPYYAFDIVKTLSDKNKVCDEVLAVLKKDKFSFGNYVRWLLKIMTDVEYIITILKEADEYTAAYYISNSDFDDKTKYRMLTVCNITVAKNLYEIAETLKDQEIIKKIINLMPKNRTYTADAISLLDDIEEKIRLAKQLHFSDDRALVLGKFSPEDRIKYANELDLSDSDKSKLITALNLETLDFLYSEEERIKYAIQLNVKGFQLAQIAMSVKNPNLITPDVMKNLENGLYLLDLVKEFKNIDLAIKSLDYLSDGYKIKCMVQYFDDKSKAKYLHVLTGVHDAITVIKSIKDEDVLKELFYNCKGFKYTRNPEVLIRTEIINSLTDLEVRNKFIFETLSTFRELVEGFDFIHNLKGNDIDKFINAYREILDKEDEIAEFENVVEFDKEYSKLEWYESRYRVLKEALAKRIIPQSDLVKYIAQFDNEDDRLKLIEKLDNDDLKINAYHLNPFTEELRRKRFVDILRSQVNRYNELDILDNSTHKIFVIMEFNPELQAKALEKVPDYIDVFKNFFVEGDYKLLSAFDNDILSTALNSKQQLIIKEFCRYSKHEVKEHFKNYIKKNYDKLSERDIIKVSELVFSIETSNAEEISKKADSFIDSVLSADDPIDSFKKVENIYLQNHLPYFAKAYLTFLTVHPDFSSYGFKDSKTFSHLVTSPVLNESNLIHKKAIVLSDLIKCNLGSNNLDFKNYLDRLEYAEKLYANYRNAPFESLSDEEKELLTTFRDSLYTIYDKSLYKKVLLPTSDVIGDISKIDEIYRSRDNGTLTNRIISSFCHFIGVNSLEEARNYMKRAVDYCNENSVRIVKSNEFSIKQGDFVKGFDINYFFDMIQTGIVAKDYLGADMDTDSTALDTDLSRIWADTTGMSINDIIDEKDHDSGHFGQAYIVIKDNPDKIRITKTSRNEEYSRVETAIKEVFFDDKLEAFSNGNSTHISNPYGIRTGFPSSMIDFIVFDEAGGTYRENIYKLKLPMVMNGYYIPIISKKTGDLLFTIEEYKELRSKMNGLSRYGIKTFAISDNIDGEEYRNIASEIEDSSKVINSIKSEILKTISDGLDDEFDVTTHIDGTLSKEKLQVLDIGSTGRLTNVPYDGDFDFIVRINRSIDIDSNKKEQFIKKLLSKFNIVKFGNRVDGDIKEMVVKIGEKDVKLDLSFVRKTNKVSYSSEMCVSDRLSTIRNQDLEAYKLVLANIIYAKKYLKENECYKKGQHGQGGLGGIGVENWILQHGGSFYDAAKSFVDCAYTESGETKDFVQFVTDYQVWDFGENFYTARTNSNQNKKDSLHDNFISKNLTSEGYKKMCAALKAYVDNYTMEGKQKG